MKKITVQPYNTQRINTSTLLDRLVVVFIFLLVTSSCTKDHLEDIDAMYNLNDFEEYVERDNHSSQYIYNQNNM